MRSNSLFVRIGLLEPPELLCGSRACLDVFEMANETADLAFALLRRARLVDALVELTGHRVA